ncbi:hypothetical protein ACIBTZ_31655 [Micromonospora sp. NPDC049460]|uniref:hypothetical protein n=1 Tax=unclassified Micromonospora TaxID=2617518 RepID=UPI0037238EDD
MFAINIPLDSLRVDARAPELHLHGQTWITIDGHDFPERHWADSPLSFLGSLRAAIREAAGGEEADFYFWEGAYFVKLVPRPDGVAVFAVHDADLDEGGAVEASCVSTLGELGRLYQAEVSRLMEWAQRHQERDLRAFLARILPLPELDRP